MKPTQVSIALRRIASRIEASKNPNKDLVLASLKGVIRNFAGTADHKNWLEPISSDTSASALVWHAFVKNDAHDWHDGITLDKIIETIKNIVKENPTMKKHLNNSVDYATRNFDMYNELKAAGEVE